MLNLVQWPHVVFLCESRKLFRMSLVIVVRHYTEKNIQKYTGASNQEI